MTETTSADSETAPREEMLRAIEEVRRESLKAAGFHAALDALLVFVAATLLFSLFTAPSPTMFHVSLSDPVRAGFDAVGIALPELVAVSATGFVLAIAAVGWFFADAVIRYSTLGVERFEADNPAVEEALRTARDTADTGADDPVATELYRDVLDRLQDTSSRGLVDRRQVLAVVGLLVVAVGFSVGAAGAGLFTAGETIEESSGSGLGQQSGAGPGLGGETAGETGSNDLLGEEGEVERGTEDQAIRLDGDGTGDGTGGVEYSGGSFDTETGDVEATHAEFSGEDRPENAELVREYNEAIRESTEETDSE
ncbi:MAG: hypothetical protein PPP58_09270 [Natronomonas sp.]